MKNKPYAHLIKPNKKYPGEMFYIEENDAFKA